MENGTISRLNSSTSIQQNSHHYLPMLMTTGSKMSGSVFSYLGPDPNATVKESGTPGASRDTMDGLRSTTATALESKPVVVGPVRRASNSSESEPVRKGIVSNMNGDQHTTATEIASHAAEHDGDAPKESTHDTSSKTAGTSQPPKASADLIDGALSDFDGSDLSDLSSASTSSGSDHETEKEDEEDSGADDDDDASDGSKDDEEDEDESMDNSSASDDSDSRSRSNSRHTKESGTKNAARPKLSRRIQSDSSEGEEGREIFKRKPGRPPKLKNHAVGSKTAQTPTSPVAATFSNRAQAKRIANGSSEVAEIEQVTSQTTVDERQPKKKTKLPDFANVGKRDRSGRTQLFKYTAIGDLETCRRLIEAGAQVNDRDYAEWTPLHEACVTGHEKVAELLIQHHADVNARGGQMDTPLHDAAQNGHVEVVKLLLSHGANVLAKNAKGVIPMDVTDDKEVADLLQRRQNLVNMLTGKNQAGQTLLHRACSSGSYSNVFELLNQGADINAKDNAQWTPLHEAALEGHMKIVELLLSSGADPNAQGHGKDTALHDSAQNEHEEVVRVLLEYGADPDFKNAKGDKPCDVTTNDDILGLLKTGARSTKKPLPRSAGSVVSPSSSLSSLSSQASKISPPSNRSKANDKSKRKKEGSADANMSDDVRSASEERPVQMSRDERKMQQLLSTIRMQEQMEERKKAKKRRPKQIVEDDGDDDEPDQKPSRSSVWKQSVSRPHHSAGVSTSKSGKSGSKTRPSRSERDDDSDSEPSVNSRQSRRSVQRSAGDRFRIDHRYKDSAGRTQLHQWAESGDIEMVGTLLEGGAERDPRDHEGLTPLHVAAKAGNTEVLVLLLAYGCNVNAQDQEKITALHEAVRHHHTEAVRLLLQNNAIVSLRDSKKRTCFDLASPKDVEIRTLLKASLEQAELKTKERSKKRLSQCTESYGSPKHKERKTSRHSDSDEPVKSKKKDSDRRDIDEKKQHSRNGSSSGVISKSTSMPSIAVSQSPSSSSNTPASLTTTNGSTGSWKYSSSDVKGEDVVAPLKKQKLHSRRVSTSGMSADMQGDDDVEMKSSGSSSKKRRESDRHGDGYGGKVKIKKEREEEGHFRAPSLSTKSEDLRRVASLPSFSKDINSNNNTNGSSNSGSKASRHASKLSLSSSRPVSALGISAGSSIASISPPLTETSSSPPPTSAQSLAAQEVEAQRSRKRSSQTFASPSGYQKFADDLKLGSAASHQHHHRQRSATSIPTARSAVTPSPASAATEVSSAAAETDLARKKARMSASELSTEYVNGKGLIKESTAAKTEESDKTSAGIEKIKKEEAVENQVPSQRSVKDAQRYLPLYTVQLSSDGADSDSTSTPTIAKPTPHASQQQQQHFCVVDRQVQLLLGLAPGTLFARYPHLHRRLVTNREKVRLWSPLSSMVSDRCAAAVKLNFEILPAECQFSSWTNATTAMSRLKEHEKQKFLGCELYFIRLEEVIELIKLDYAQLNESMMTIALDIGYDEEELAMEVEEDAINNSSSTTTIKIEEKEERLSKVKEEEDPDSTRPTSALLASGPVSLSSSSISAPASLSGTSGGGFMHKMRRVPAKMATKAMFKEMQQQYRSS